ncbi:MAG: RHS repeat-associated core domain-containing protein, partial [Prevotellaceae bacterium]|nr:RHS repeat-associated core domain-containing protein [Prevotellaceae bacterium]
ETDSIGNVRKIHYLAGGSLFIQNCGNDTLLYAYHDFQGSLIALTDEDGNVVERYAYDPWGARRNSEKWEEKDQRTNHLIDRGYTGHEHIDAFAIINMNGRIYDPLTATFFSVDPYVQSPDDWLNYNRYAYCMFNPFLYVDPSGYTWFNKLGNWFRNNWQSIVTTAVTVAAGVAVGAIIVASCGTAAPLLVAASAGMAAGFAGGVTHGILSGQSIGDIMKSGLIGAGKGLLFGTLGGVASTFAPAGALWGSLYGAGTGSFIGMVGSAMTGDDITEGMIFGAASGFFGGFFQGYCSAKNQGLNPWTGAKLPETTVNTPNMPFEMQTETAVAEKATIENPSTPVGRRGYEMNCDKSNSAAEIGTRKYSGHALDRMQGRGFVPSVVEDAINDPLKTYLGNTPNTTVYENINIKVIINQNGDVITVIPR